MLNSFRYVLKDKDTGEVLFVVVFTLLRKEAVEKGAIEDHEDELKLAADNLPSKSQGEKSFEPQSTDVD